MGRSHAKRMGHPTKPGIGPSVISLCDASALLSDVLVGEKTGGRELGMCKLLVRFDQKLQFTWKYNVDLRVRYMDL